MAQKQQTEDHEERQFHISVSYSTIGSSPEDALETFFAAVQHPGAMVAEIYEDGQQHATEIDGNQIIQIAQGQFGETGPAKDLVNALIDAAEDATNWLDDDVRVSALTINVRLKNAIATIKHAMTPKIENDLLPTDTDVTP